MVKLLQPFNDEDLVLGAWSLERLDVGPYCELRLGFRSPDGDDPVTATLRPSGSSAGSFLFFWEPVRPPHLGDALEVLVMGNDPGDFFRDRCRSVDDPEGDPGDPEEDSLVLDDAISDHGGPWFARLVSLLAVLGLVPWSVVLRICLVALLAGLGLAVLGRGRPPVEPAGPGLWAEPRWVLGIFFVGLVLRSVTMVFAPHSFYEFEFVTPGFAGLLDCLRIEAPFLVDGGFLHATRTFHTPLLRMLLYPWHLLGDAFGVGGTLLWLRLPTLGLAAWMMVLLLRVGRHLGQPTVGRAAMVLFALLPRGVFMSALVGHYLLEMVLSAWFLERLLAAVCGKREVWRQVAVAAGAAAWAGYMTWPLVALGVIAGMVHLARRGARRDLLAFALATAALATPLIGSALDSVTAYDAACVPLDELSELDEVVPVYDGHPIFDVSERTAVGVVRVPWLLAVQLYHPAVAVLAVAGFLLLLLRRPREALLPALLFLFYGYARTRMQLSLDNLRLLNPLMLLLPVWGFRSLPALRLPRCSRVLDGRRFVQGFVALALLTGAGQRLERGEYLPDTSLTPFYQGMVQWMAGDNLYAIRAALSVNEDRSLPLVMSDEVSLLHVGVCYGFSSHTELLRCLDTGLDQRLPERDRGPAGQGRDVFLLPGFSCEDLGQHSAVPAWRAERFFVLLSVGMVPYDWPACFAAEGGACEVAAETPALRLWRCTLDGGHAVGASERGAFWLTSQ